MPSEGVGFHLLFFGVIAFEAHPRGVFRSVSGHVPSVSVMSDRLQGLFWDVLFKPNHFSSVGAIGFEPTTPRPPV